MTEYERLAQIAGTKPAGTVERKLANIRACDALALQLKRAAQQIDAATAELKQFNDQEN